jgi:predicted enzyme related to lactoylglutathione lyase
VSLRLKHVTFNCAEPRALAEFWAQATAGQVSDDWGDFVVVNAEDLGGMFLGFQRVPERKFGRNRVHLDLHTEDRQAEVERLTGLGARAVEEHGVPGLSWTVMLDPEGNEFCVAEE